MPSSATALTSSRPDLAEGLVEFDLLGNMAGMVAAQIFRPLPVAGTVGKFGRIPIEQLISKQKKTAKGIGANYGRDEWTFITESWTTERHGREGVIDDQERNIYGEYFDLEMVTAQRIQNQVMEGSEERVVPVITNETTWSAQTASAAVAWGTVGTSTPLVDVKVAKAEFRKRTGVKPNALCIDWETCENLLITESLIDISRHQNYIDVRAKSLGETPSAAKMTLSALFNLPYIIISDAVENTAAQGLTAVVGSTFPVGTALVTRVAETMDIREPCIGRTFYYAEDGTSGDFGGGMMRPVVESYRDEPKESDVIRVKFDVDEKLLYSEMIQLIAVD